jgi:hypothetical protein
MARSLAQAKKMELSEVPLPWFLRLFAQFHPVEAAVDYDHTRS